MIVLIDGKRGKFYECSQIWFPVSVYKDKVQKQNEVYKDTFSIKVLNSFLGSLFLRFVLIVGPICANLKYFPRGFDLCRVCSLVSIKNTILLNPDYFISSSRETKWKKNEKPIEIMIEIIFESLNSHEHRSAVFIFGIVGIVDGKVG